MNAAEFEQFLHQQIPITQAMGIHIATFSPECVRVTAALAPNINHQQTAFGGSIHTVMTVCGWSLMFANFRPRCPEAHIVIQQSEIRYLAPIRADFTAECTLTDADARQTLLTTFDKYGKGKLNLHVTCREGETLLADYHARFVVTK